MASRLVSSTPGERSGFQPWPGEIVFCSWARHFTLTVPLTTQVSKWEFNGGNLAMD